MDISKQLTYLYILTKNRIYSKSPELKICIDGFDENTGFFLDSALQICQFSDDRRPDVTVYLREGEEKNKLNYLRERPQLRDFFCIDGEEPRYCKPQYGSYEKYGDIRFVAGFPSADEKAKSYYFSNASAIRRYAEDLKDELNEIERIAFNVHLAYCGTLDISFEEQKEIFKDKAHGYYNYISNLTFAISLIYKLHGLGYEYQIGIIPEDGIDVIKAKLSIPENKRIYAEAEHRRWVTDKLCRGWSRLESDNISYDDGINRSKNNGAKKHFCIVPADYGSHLLPDFDWDSGDITELDELDTVSVIRYRRIKDAADRLKTDDLFSEIGRLKNSLSPSEIIAVNDWTSCIDVLYKSGFRAGSTAYRKYSDRLDGLLPSGELHNYVDKVKKYVFYALEAARKMDFKKTDYMLIEKIPFILLYGTKNYYAADFEYTISDNRLETKAYSGIDYNRLFRYIFLLKKAHPTALYLFDDFPDTNFETAVRHLDNYLENCGKHYSTEIVIYYNRSRNNDYGIPCRNLKIKGLNRSEYKAKKDDVLSSYEITYVYFDLEKSKLAEKETNYKCFEDVFEGSKCRKSGSLTFRTKMDIREMLTVSGSESCKSDNPTDDYGLMELFLPYAAAWNALCSNIANAVKVKNQADFLSGEKKDKKYVWTFGFSAGPAVEKCLDFMTVRNIIASVVHTETGACFYCSEHTEIQLDKIRGDIESCSDIRDIEFLHKNGREHISVIDDLKIENLGLADANQKSCTEQEVLLKEWENRGYIRSLVIKDAAADTKISTASFEFTGPDYRSILSKAGNAFEMWIYKLLIESDEFDDYATGHEIFWYNSLKGRIDANEIDALLIKGTKSIFIECKSCSKLEEKFTEKLRDAKNGFGINPIGILIIASAAYGNQLKSNKENAEKWSRSCNIPIIYLDIEKNGGDRNKVYLFSSGIDESDEIAETVRKIIEDKFNCLRRLLNP